MENQELNKLTRYEMESMLPDYLFGGLDESARNNFEAALGDFPEIRQEIKDVRNVFSKLDSMDLNSDIPSRTRNISLKVHERLNRKKSFATSRSAFIKLAFPTLALLLIAFFLVNRSNFNQVNRQTEALLSPKISEKIENSFQNSDLLALAPDSETMSAVQTVAQHNITIPVILDKSELDDMSQSQFDFLNNLILSDFLHSETEMKEYFSKVDFNPANSEDDFENLDESQFQKLIKDLKNEKFSS